MASLVIVSSQYSNHPNTEWSPVFKWLSHDLTPFEYSRDLTYIPIVSCQKKCLCGLKGAVQ